MANNVIRARGAPVQRSAQAQQGWPAPAPGTQDGNWVWDGSEWVCNPDCGYGGGVPAPCPPFGPPVFSGPAGQPPWYPGANGGVSFGAAAPPNPVRGHLWWDGTTFWLFDGAAWVAVSAPPPGAPGTDTDVASYVQLTAPPSPNKGDFWFDTVQQHVWDGSAWRTIGPGMTAGPVPTTTKVFQLSPSADVPLTGAAGGIIIVPFTATPSIDVNSGWNPTTHQFLPNKAGQYLFTCFQTIPVGVSYSGHFLVLNDNGTAGGGPQVCTDSFATTGTVIVSLQSTGIIHLNGTTDFVRLWAESSDNIFHIVPSQPAISAWLLP
jgi:hypothetical protein